MDKKLKIVGISGSLRKGSYNSALLRAAQALVPAEAELEILDISAVPVYNQDDEANMPQVVKDLKTKIEAADAVLFSTPEYNYSIPGGLKNMMEWMSRPYGQNSFDDKPAAIISSSIGVMGGSRAQYHLRQVFIELNMHSVNHPGVIVGFAQNKVDAQGNLTDEETKTRIKDQLQALVIWTKRIQVAK